MQSFDSFYMHILEYFVLNVVIVLCVDEFVVLMGACATELLCADETVLCAYECFVLKNRFVLKKP
jgi:hypothetical protein